VPCRHSRTSSYIERGHLLDILEHPNPDRYARQRIFAVQRYDDVFLVPFIGDRHTVFVKTINPRRKAEAVTR